MKRILAVMVFFAGVASLALSQTADEQEDPKGEKTGVEQIVLQMERDGNEANSQEGRGNLSNFIRDLPESEMDKPFFFLKLNTQTEIKM